MKLIAICFSKNGAQLINRIKDSLPDDEVMGFCRMKGEDPEEYGLLSIEGETSELVGDCFAKKIPIIFVCACGIAVRLIAPFITDKLKDIPVIVIDELGENVIPILSGHVGGANVLSARIALALGANPVITTATDVNRTFSVDSFAMENRLTINNKDGIKSVSGKILKGEPIRISIESFPPEETPDVLISDTQIDGNYLWLSPKRYVMGIGCKRGKSREDIEKAINQAFNELQISYNDIYAFASIDKKADEEGLLELSAVRRLPFVTFSAGMLEKAQGNFSSSDFVKDTVGVDNVCERAAILLTGGRGELVFPKKAEDGVTIAIARRYF